jgi:hypothetical protein
MAIPFLLTAALVDQFLKFSKKIKPYFRAIEISAGAVLVAVGVLMVIDRFELLKVLLLKILPEQISRLG